MKHYPSIVTLDKLPEIYAVKQVIAHEKLHGSNARLFFPLGMKSIEEVGFGSHDVEYQPGKDFPLGNFIIWFKNRPELLTRMMEVIQSYGYGDVTIFGEAFGPGIRSKGVKYSTGQEMLFRGFDMMIGDNPVTDDILCDVFKEMGLPKVHEVYRGEPNKEVFDELLKLTSKEGTLNGIVDNNNIAEGIVIRSNPLLRTVFGDWLICKHKSAKFAEISSAPKTKAPRGILPADEFAAKFVTEGRLRNAVGRLEDRGVGLSNTMKDMPTILTEIVADLFKECKDEWVSADLDDKSVKGAVSRILGPIYREFLGI